MEEILAAGQDAYRAANPAYEEMEGIVAGVPRLARYDVDIDAGSDGSEPENAVSFSLELPDGEVLEQPGNFMFLAETSWFATNEDFLAKGVYGDVDEDGEVSFGEGLPDANFPVAAMRSFDEMADQLDADAQAFEPTESDAFTAITVMTPTMSEYFEAWKNSRFVRAEAPPTSSSPPRASRTSPTSSRASSSRTRRSSRGSRRSRSSRRSKPEPPCAISSPSSRACETARRGRAVHRRAG